MTALNEVSTREQFHILSKKPRERLWQFRQFNGASTGDEDTAQAALRKAERDAPPGWKFKIMKRTVVTTYSPWEDVEAS